MTISPIIRKGNKFLYNGKAFDSKGEVYFYWYLSELFDNGFIFRFAAQPQTFELARRQEYSWTKMLKTKTKPMVSTILQGHSYTPDFLILWTKKSRNIFYNTSDDVYNLRRNIFLAKKYTFGQEVSYIEVKPEFGKHGSFRWFTISQKWVYQKYGIYIQKINPVSIFQRTFTPGRYLITDGGRQTRKLKYNPILLEGFIKTAAAGVDVSGGLI